MIKEIYDVITNHGSLVALAIVLLGGLIEVSPIKVNPIGWLGERFNKKISDEVKSLKSELEDHKVDSWRNDILSFANSCMNHTKHTKEEFDQIIELHDKYEKYITENKIQNGRMTAAYEYIMQIYHKCLEEDSFL